ncbi:MAG: seryl-tRNA synthetase, partial [Halorubrum sp. J07HR59]
MSSQSGCSRPLAAAVRIGITGSTRFLNRHTQVRVMLSRQYVRSNPDTVRDACEKKGVDVDVDRILEIDEEWRELKSHGDDLRHEQNEISAQIGQFKQAGEETKAEEAIEQSQTLKDELEEVSTRADELETRLKERLLEVPGIPHESVPAGVDEQDNIPRRREGF